MARKKKKVAKKKPGSKIVDRPPPITGSIVRGSARIEREGRDRRKKGRREPENRVMREDEQW